MREVKNTYRRSRWSPKAPPQDLWRDLKIKVKSFIKFEVVTMFPSPGGYTFGKLQVILWIPADFSLKLGSSVESRYQTLATLWLHDWISHILLRKPQHIPQFECRHLWTEPQEETGENALVLFVTWRSRHFRKTAIDERWNLRSRLSPK